MEIKDLIDGIAEKQTNALNEVKEQGAASIAEVKSQMEEKGAEVEARLKDLEQKSATPVGVEKEMEVKSLGQALVETQEYKDAVETRTARKAEIKAATGEVTNTVAATRPQHLAGVVALPEFAPNVYNLLAKVNVTNGLLDYVREKTFTKATAETAEGTAKPLSKAEFEAVQVPVPTIAHLIKVSEQMLADNTAVASLLDAQMGSRLLTKVDELVLKGAGQLKGLTDATNSTAFTGKAGQSAFDLIRGAQAAIETDGFTATAVILHPNDVAALDTAKDKQDAYLAANPRANNAPTVWGLPVIKSVNIAEGTAIVLDQAYVNLYVRQGATVELGFDGDDFSKNMRTIRAEMRVGMAVSNKAAVRTIDITVP